jgi:hypothetical protein
MRESNENAQQRSYYLAHRVDSRYWWSLFIFLLNAAVLNAYKIWDHLYSESNLSHLKLQHQIAKMLIINEISREYLSKLSICSFETMNQSSSCE